MGWRNNKRLLILMWTTHTMSGKGRKEKRSWWLCTQVVFGLYYLNSMPRLADIRIIILTVIAPLKMILWKSIICSSKTINKIELLTSIMLPYETNWLTVGFLFIYLIFNKFLFVEELIYVRRYEIVDIVFHTLVVMR
jgi:hypothetical protein